MAGITNWIFEESTTAPERSRAALESAKRLEAKKIKKGWRYYKVDDRTMVLVPFGKDGKPTELGLKIIESQKAPHFL